MNYIPSLKCEYRRDNIDKEKIIKIRRRLRIMANETKKKI